MKTSRSAAISNERGYRTRLAALPQSVVPLVNIGIHHGRKDFTDIGMSPDLRAEK